MTNSSESENYIHKNPVKQLLVKEAPQYPYSSAHYGFELDPAPVYLNPKLYSVPLKACLIRRQEMRFFLPFQKPVNVPIAAAGG